MALTMTSRAETWAFSRASSSMRRTVWMASSRASSSIFLMSVALASSWVRPEMRSSSAISFLTASPIFASRVSSSFSLVLEAVLLLGEVALLPLDGLEAPLEVLLLVDEPALGLADLPPLFAGLVLEIGLAGQVLLLGLDGRFALDLLGVLGRPGQDSL